MQSINHWLDSSVPMILLEVIWTERAMAGGQHGQRGGRPREDGWPRNERLVWPNSAVRYSASQISDHVHSHSSGFLCSALVTLAPQTQTNLSFSLCVELSVPGNQLVRCVYCVIHETHRNRSITVVPTERKGWQTSLYLTKKCGGEGNGPPQTAVFSG